jgi:arginase family enzyme
MSVSSRRLGACLAVCATALLLGLGAQAAPKGFQYPASLAPKLSGLTADERAFINDTAKLEVFGLTPERLSLELEKREATEVKAYVAGLLTVVEESKFHDGDMGELPLNTEASSFNGGTILRPAILDERTRDPGPISLQRYLHQRTGIPTFANAPVAVRKEDLVAGKVEVAFVGVPLDMSSGYRDAKHAPTTLRITDGLVGSDVDAQIDPTLVLRIADYGNLAVDNMSVERPIGHGRFRIADIVSTGAVPFIVGGDRALTYPDVAGVVDTLGKGKVALVSFSPHPDAIADFDHELVDAVAVGRVLTEGLVDGKNLVQIGLRGPQAKAADLQRLGAQGVRYHTMAEVEKSGWDTVMARALKDVTGGPEGVFISFDMSVLDPGDAPGVGRPVPGGLTMREVTPLIRRLCAETKVVGLELLDVAPIMDPTYKTAMNANRIMNACLTGIAMRKEGLTKPGYLSPVSLGAKR